jgi:AcrR family transcriptional regulator
MTPVVRVRASSAEGARRTEILDTAAKLFASSGFRTSLKEIADACGILAGSLYHHFDSKEAIVVELVERYQAELDCIAAQAHADLRGEKSMSDFDRIAALAVAIAECASRHRAAMLQTFYEPPAGASEEFIRLVKRTPAAIYNAMLEVVRAGCAHGSIRQGIDLAKLAEQICQSMLHTAVGALHRTAGARQVATLKCRMLLEGIAVQPPKKAELDASNAFAAAEKAIASWNRLPEENGQVAHLKSVARIEFGRRGYEATTIRDIASAANMSTGAVYRLIGSKDALLESIMTAYIRHVNGSWDAVMASKSNPIEKLDALMWIDINLLSHFIDEFKIQLAWLRQSPPPSSPKIDRFTNNIRHMKSLLADGERKGQFRIHGATANIRAQCMVELTWISENIVRRAGAGAALAHARDTLLRGAAERR